MPIEVEAMWRRLRSDMLDLKAGFEIWIEWYERRLWGVPPSMALEKSWATLPNAWLDVDPADINAYLQSLAKGGPAKEPPDSLKTAAARNKERAAGYLKLLPFVKRDPKFAESLAETERKNKAHFRQNWWDAIKAALDWRGLPFLILATYGAVAFISRTFGVPAHDPPLSEVYSGYEWLRDWIFAPLVAITSFVQLGFPIWLKDLTFVYLRIGSSLRSTLMTAYFPSKKPRRLLDFFKGKAERSELIASAVASLMWPWHFFGFAIVRVDPVKAYYDTNPSIFQIFAPASDIVRPGVFNRLIAFFTVNILTIVLLTCAYFTLNAFLAV